ARPRPAEQGNTPHRRVPFSLLGHPNPKGLTQSTPKRFVSADTEAQAKATHLRLRFSLRRQPNPKRVTQWNPKRFVSAETEAQAKTTHLRLRFSLRRQPSTAGRQLPAASRSGGAEESMHFIQRNRRVVQRLPTKGDSGGPGWQSQLS